MTDIVPLEFMLTGEQGCISDVDGNPDLVHRLAELGFQVGAQVKMMRPGSPCILTLNHQRLLFRGESQATILVEVARDALAAVPAHSC